MFHGRIQILKTGMMHRFVFTACLSLLFFSTNPSASEYSVVPFAKNGTLKMLYDNRMYPQAVNLGQNVYFVWRGENGYPFVNRFNPNGMNEGTKPKILAVGKGKHEAAMIPTIHKSGYTGPIGILDHRNDTDTEVALRENLVGLRRILEPLGDKKMLESYSK